MTANYKKYRQGSPAVVKTAGLPFFIHVALLLIMLSSLTGCKPTEKNYRSAYDVAREKRDRDRREREELRSELGIGEGVIQDVEGYSLATIGGGQVWTRHLNFSRQDSVAPYAVAAATFRMDTNARAMTSDLRSAGWEPARYVGDGKNWYVIVGESDSESGAIESLRRFREAHPDWQYVGQPGIALLIGGSR